MSGLFVAKRYAAALYEAALMKGQLDDVVKDIDTIDSLLNQADSLKQFCRRSGIGQKAAREFVNISFVPYVCQTTVSFLKLIVENERLALLVLLREAFEEISDKKENRVRVNIELTEDPDDKFLGAVSRQMESRQKKEVLIKWSINKKLIKGFRIFWENRLIDRSAAGRLRKIRTILKRGAAGKKNE